MSSQELFLVSLNDKYNNLMEIMKLEKEPKKIKEIESEINKIQNVIKSLSSLINYYKLKEIKSKASNK